jgi:hypothetical protein
VIEKIETLNQRLIDNFGLYLDGRPLWRLVFSSYELEKRWTNYTKEGYELLTREVIEVPKYKQWINPPCFILERLLELPEGIPTDQINKTSYEPVWVFRDRNHEPLIPVWAAISLIIETVYENSSRAVGRKYKDPREELTDPKIAIEAREMQLRKLEGDLFGNETEIGDALAYREGIVIPKNYEKKVN